MGAPGNRPCEARWIGDPAGCELRTSILQIFDASFLLRLSGQSNLLVQASRLSSNSLQRSLFFFARMSCSEQSAFHGQAADPVWFFSELLFQSVAAKKKKKKKIFFVLLFLLLRRGKTFSCRPKKEEKQLEHILSSYVLRRGEFEKCATSFRESIPEKE